MAMQPNIEIPVAVAPVKPEKRHVTRPLSRFLLRFRQRGQHRPPRPQRLDRTTVQRTSDRLDPRAGGGVHILRLILGAREQTHTQRFKWLRDAAKRAGETIGGGCDQVVQRSHIAFDSAIGALPRRRTIRRRSPSQHLLAHQSQEQLGRIALPRLDPFKFRTFLAQPGSPTGPRQSARRLQHGLQRRQQIGAIGDQILDSPLQATRTRTSTLPAQQPAPQFAGFQAG